ncbi:MAG: GHMP family kinase ATP-binding protein [Candidatus Nitrospinota bacterium M3_3B_026]
MRPEKDAVTATAPARIDLAGGTLDIWPLNLMFDGPVTVNMAVDIRARASVKRKRDNRIILISEDREKRMEFENLRALHHRHALGMLSRIAERFLDGGGVEIRTRSEAPAGAGLAGSSALNIAITAAMARLADERLGGERLIAVARDIEAALLRVPTGLQDYGAAVYGGVNVFHFPPGGMRRENLPAAGRLLEERILLFYSGQSRNSGINNWEMFKRVIEGDRRAVSRFGKIAALAREAAGALRRGDMESFVRAVRQEWKARRGLFPGISTPMIDKAAARARRAGADAARILGAGGGGCFIIIVAPRLREAVARAVEGAGPRRIPFSLSGGGLKVYTRQY